MRTYFLLISILTASLVTNLLAPLALSAQSSAQICKPLQAYRDGPLFADWDLAIKQASTFATQRADLTNLRSELASTTYWQTTDATLLRAQVAMSFKLLMSSINGIIGTGLAFAPVGAAKTLTESVLEGALLSTDFTEVANVFGTGKAVGISIAAELNPVAKAIMNIALFAHDVKELQDTPEERDKLKQIANERLNALDAALAQNETNLKKWSNRSAVADNVKQLIDRYSLTHCK